MESSLLQFDVVIICCFNGMPVESLSSVLSMCTTGIKKPQDLRCISWHMQSCSAPLKLDLSPLQSPCSCHVLYMCAPREHCLNFYVHVVSRERGSWFVLSLSWRHACYAMLFLPARCHLIRDTHLYAMYCVSVSACLHVYASEGLQVCHSVSFRLFVCLFGCGWS